MTEWKSTRFAAVAQVLDKLTELQGNRWLCRGQGRLYNCLQPSIDRDGREHLSRIDKLKLERQSIDMFRSTARIFAGEGEMGALRHDVVALMVMRHHGVPTRLLDWSLSPFVATFFACETDAEDGELWAFSYDQYLSKGNEQWKAMPEALTDGKWDPDRTAFTTDDPPDWFTCHFYSGFPRQDAQRGLYSMTARLGLNHDKAIAKLLIEKEHYHRYLIPSKLKSELRRFMRELHGVWRGSLFPDSAGAAATVVSHIFPSMKAASRKGGRTRN